MSTIHLDYSGVRCYNSLEKRSGDESTMKIVVVNIMEETKDSLVRIEHRVFEELRRGKSNDGMRKRQRPPWSGKGEAASPPII